MSPTQIERQKVKIERAKGSVTRSTVSVRRVRPGEQPPNVDSFFDARGIEHPLPAAEMGGDLQAPVDAENSAMLEAIIAAKKERRDQFRNATDPNYYFIVCFQNTAQRMEFLEATGWDKPEAKIIDGLALAARLGVKIEPINLPRTAPRAMPKALRGHSIIE